MVAGPSIKALGAAGFVEMTEDVAIGIEDADRRYIERRKALLPSNLLQQGIGRKHRCRLRKFVF